MALTVSTAPQYTGTLAVGSGSTAQLGPGGLQGAPVQIQGSGTPAYNTGAVLGATTANNGAATFAPDPAAIAAANARANLARDTGIAFGGIVSGAETSREDNTNKYRNDAGDFVTGVRTGQETINTNRANNALNLRRSMASIANGVRTGLRSGGVQLANMNALDSGAAEAMARAYATTGNSQVADASNQAQLKANEIDSSQRNLDTTRATGLERLKSWRNTETARVSNKLWQDLSELDAKAAAGGVNGAVDMGMRDRVIQVAQAELDQIDAVTNSALGQIHGLTPEEVQAQAMQMDQAGAVGTAPFSVEAGTVSAPGTQTPNGASVGQFGLAPAFRRDDKSALV